MPLRSISSNHLVAVPDVPGPGQLSGPTGSKKAEDIVPAASSSSASQPASRVPLRGANMPISPTAIVPNSSEAVGETKGVDIQPLERELAKIDSHFPGIKIEYDPKTHPDFPLQVNNTLQRIKDGGPSGEQLINDFSTYSSKRDHQVIIRPTGNPLISGCNPELSDRQAGNWKMNQTNNAVLANQFAQKRSFGPVRLKGPGANAGVQWAPGQRNEESLANLAKELVHARRIVKGTYIGGPQNGDPNDPGSKASKEERRALGFGEYGRSKLPSQRSIISEQERNHASGSALNCPSTASKLISQKAAKVNASLNPSFDGVSLSESDDPRVKYLIGEAKKETIKVANHTLDGLRLAEEVIHDVKTKCVRTAGNQAADIYATSGWSYAVAQAARYNVGMGKYKDSPTSAKAAEVIRHGAGTCELYGIVSYVVTSEKIRELKKIDPFTPLTSLPIHRVKDSEGDHSYVVLGRRKDGGKGKFEGEAIIIDSWPGLAKPFVRKEASDLMKNIDSVSSVEWSSDPCAPSGAFSLDETLKTPAVTEEEMQGYLQKREAPQQAGEALKSWVVQEHEKRNFIDDRITPVNDVSTRYVDKSGRRAVFDHIDKDYLNKYLTAHQAADESGFLRYAD
jgi:hypothetical protein